MRKSMLGLILTIVAGLIGICLGAAINLEGVFRYHFCDCSNGIFHYSCNRRQEVKFGFKPIGERQKEEGTTEYVIKMRR